MISAKQVRTLAMSLPGTEENPHFERAAFKVSGRRIFLTLHEVELSANIVLTPAQQAELSREIGISPVPNKWGLQGWTTFDLRLVSYENLSAAINLAYDTVINSSKKKK